MRKKDLKEFNNLILNSFQGFLFKTNAPNLIPIEKDNIIAGISKIPWGRSLQREKNPASAVTKDEIKPIDNPLDIRKNIGTIENKKPVTIEIKPIEELWLKINHHIPKKPFPSVFLSNSSIIFLISSSIGWRSSSGAIYGKINPSIKNKIKTPKTTAI